MKKRSVIDHVALPARELIPKLADPDSCCGRPTGTPLQKRTEVQWDIGAAVDADDGADESTSPQAGIRYQPPSMPGGSTQPTTPSDDGRLTVIARPASYTRDQNQSYRTLPALDAVIDYVIETHKSAPLRVVEIDWIVGL